MVTGEGVPEVEVPITTPAEVVEEYLLQEGVQEVEEDPQEEIQDGIVSTMTGIETSHQGQNLTEANRSGMMNPGVI